MNTVHFSPEAEQDLRDIFDYLNAHSQTAAEQLADSMDQRIAILAAHPAIGRDRGDLIKGLRSVAIGRYVLFFRLNSTTLEIVRFLHGARDIDSIFHQE
jgi:toxin ParE1/3/4